MMTPTTHRRGFSLKGTASRSTYNGKSLPRFKIKIIEISAMVRKEVETFRGYGQREISLVAALSPVIIIIIIHFLEKRLSCHPRPLYRQ